MNQNTKRFRLTIDLDLTYCTDRTKAVLSSERIRQRFVRDFAEVPLIGEDIWLQGENEAVRFRVHGRVLPDNQHPAIRYSYGRAYGASTPHSVLPPGETIAGRLSLQGEVAD
jgi:hypothetical protein